MSLLKTDHPRSSRLRYRRFLQEYRLRRLDPDQQASQTIPQESTEATGAADRAGTTPGRALASPKQRQYVRDYARWLWPHRLAVLGVFALALVTAGLEMLEPLFMRHIIDRILLNADLDAPTRLTRLHVVGIGFLGVIVFSSLAGVLKDYRQRLLNARVMLSLRRGVFERMLHLPLPTLWDMKTGGTAALDVVGAAHRRRQRRDRLVRRLPAHRRTGVDWRHHGVPVVHVPAAQPGLEHRQFVLGAAAIAGGDGAGVRRARDAP